VSLQNSFGKISSLFTGVNRKGKQFSKFSFFIKELQCFSFGFSPLSVVFHYFSKLFHIYFDI
jgi:hypothetical protein